LEFDPETIRVVAGGAITRVVRWKNGESREATCKPQCRPENQERGRSVMRLEESAPVVAFRQKRAADEARAQYRRRSQVAESCHAWIKSKLDLRQFHVRGFGPDADGSAVGLPHLQPPTLDSFAQIASCHGNHLSEKRRKPETTERNVLALQS
jgi:hypothetical protein